MDRNILNVILGAALLLNAGAAFPQSKEQPSPAAGASATQKVPAIPDVIVTDQNGERHHFYRDLVQGRAVAINFIFTTCTTICPPLTANFAKIQKMMAARGEKNLRLISVSVDPENDTPERLKSYSELFHAHEGWTFVTGSRADLEQIWKAFNVYLSSKQDHPPTVAIGNDATHRWVFASGLTSADKLAAAIDPILGIATEVETRSADASKSKETSGQAH